MLELVTLVYLWTNLKGLLDPSFYDPPPRPEPLSQHEPYRYEVELSPYGGSPGCGREPAEPCVSRIVLFVADDPNGLAPSVSDELDVLPPGLRHAVRSPYWRPDPNCSMAGMEALARQISATPGDASHFVAILVPEAEEGCFSSPPGPDDHVVLLVRDGRAELGVECSSIDTYYERYCLMNFRTFGDIYWGGLHGVPLRDLRKLLNDGPLMTNEFFAELPPDAPDDLVWQPLPKTVALSSEVEALLSSIDAAGR